MGESCTSSGLKSMVFAGGSWHTSQPQYDKGDGNGVGSEIWALDVLHDRWTLLRPFCVPGETQPGGPDTVVWAYDSKRNRGLMTPGFYFITQGATSPCGAIYGLGGYAFDFVRKTFDPMPWPGFACTAEWLGRRHRCLLRRSRSDH